MSLDPAISDRMLGFVKLSAAHAEHAIGEINQSRELQKKAAAIAPTVLEKLISTKLVPVERRKMAEDTLANHAKTLELLNKAIEKIASLQAEKLAASPAVQLGTPTHGKVAYDEGRPAPFSDAPRRGEGEAERMFREGIAGLQR